MPAQFPTIVKQHGAMVAKGRLMGVQFDTLFTDDLYFRIGRHAVTQAMRIRDAFRSHGCEFLYDSPTNQQFPILTNEVLAELGKEFAYSPWEKVDENRTAVRFCTSWATKAEDVDTLIAALDRVL